MTNITCMLWVLKGNYQILADKVQNLKYYVDDFVKLLKSCSSTLIFWRRRYKKINKIT